MSSKNSVIYKLVQKKMVVWLRGPEVSKPNGLYAEKNKLILGNSGDGSLKAISLVTQPETFSAFESLRTKIEISLIPKKSGPENLHVERKKFAPGEDESFL
jgi:hypothetical protein